MKTGVLQFSAHNPISFSLDTLANAAYIGISNSPVHKTVKKSNSLFIDYDKNDKMVGIEILRIQKVKAVFKKILKDTETNLPASVKKQVDKYLQLAKQ